MEIIVFVTSLFLEEEMHMALGAELASTNNPPGLTIDREKRKANARTFGTGTYVLNRTSMRIAGSTAKQKRRTKDNAIELAMLEFVPGALQKVTSGSILGRNEKYLLQAVFSNPTSEERISKRLYTFGLTKPDLDILLKVAGVRELDKKVSVETAVRTVGDELRQQAFGNWSQLEADSALIKQECEAALFNGAKEYETKIRPETKGLSETLRSMSGTIDEMAQRVFDIKTNMHAVGWEKLAGAMQSMREVLAQSVGAYNGKSAIQLEDEMCDSMAQTFFERIYGAAVEDEYRRNPSLREQDEVMLTNSVTQGIYALAELAAGTKTLQQFGEEALYASQNRQDVEDYYQLRRQQGYTAFLAARKEAIDNGTIEEFEQQVLLNEYHPWYVYYDQEIERFDVAQQEKIKATVAEHNDEEEPMSIGAPQGGGDSDEDEEPPDPEPKPKRVTRSSKRGTGTSTKKPTPKPTPLPPPPPQDQVQNPPSPRTKAAILKMQREQTALPPLNASLPSVQTTTAEENAAKKERGKAGIKSIATAHNEALEKMATVRSMAEANTTSTSSELSIFSKFLTSLCGIFAKKHAKDATSIGRAQYHSNEIVFPAPASSRADAPPGAVQSSSGKWATLSSCARTVGSAAVSILLPGTTASWWAKVHSIADSIANIPLRTAGYFATASGVFAPEAPGVPSDVSIDQLVLALQAHFLDPESPWQKNQKVGIYERFSAPDKASYTEFSERLARGGDTDAEALQRKLQERVLFMRENERAKEVWLARNNLNTSEFEIRVKAKKINPYDILPYPDLYLSEYGIPVNALSEAAKQSAKGCRHLSANTWNFMANMILVLSSSALAGTSMSFIVAPKNGIVEQHRAELANIPDLYSRLNDVKDKLEISRVAESVLNAHLAHAQDQLNAIHTEPEYNPQGKTAPPRASKSSQVATQNAQSSSSSGKSIGAISMMGGLSSTLSQDSDMTDAPPTKVPPRPTSRIPNAVDALRVVGKLNIGVPVVGDGLCNEDLAAFGEREVERVQVCQQSLRPSMEAYVHGIQSHVKEGYVDVLISALEPSKIDGLRDQKERDKIDVKANEKLILPHPIVMMENVSLYTKPPKSEGGERKVFAASYSNEAGRSSRFDGDVVAEELTMLTTDAQGVTTTSNKYQPVDPNNANLPLDMLLPAADIASTGVTHMRDPSRLVPGLLYSGDPKLISERYKTTIGNGNVPKGEPTPEDFPPEMRQHVIATNNLLGDSRAVMREDTNCRAYAAKNGTAGISQLPLPLYHTKIISEEAVTKSVKATNEGLPPKDDDSKMDTVGGFDEEKFNERTATWTPAERQTFAKGVAIVRAEHMARGGAIISDIDSKKIAERIQMVGAIINSEENELYIQRFGEPVLVDSTETNLHLYAYPAGEYGRLYELRTYDNIVTNRAWEPNRQYLLKIFEQIAVGNIRGPAVEMVLQSLVYLMSSLKNFELGVEIGDKYNNLVENLNRIAIEKAREKVTVHTDLSKLRFERITKEYDLVVVRLHRILGEYKLSNMQQEYDQRTYEALIKYHSDTGLRAISNIMNVTGENLSAGMTAATTSQEIPIATGTTTADGSNLIPQTNIPKATAATTNPEVGALMEQERQRILQLDVELATETKLDAEREQALKDATERAEKGESPVPPKEEKEDPATAPPSRWNLVAQFMFQHIFASAVSAGAAVAEAQRTFELSVKTWQSATNGQIVETLTHFSAAVESLTRIMANVNSALHLYGLSKNLFVYTGRALESVGNFLYGSGGITARIWALLGSLQAKVPETANVDTERVEPTSTIFGALHANVFAAGSAIAGGAALALGAPAAVPAILFGLGALRFGPLLGWTAESLVNWMDKTQSTTLAWLMIGTMFISFTSLAVLTCALGYAAGVPALGLTAFAAGGLTAIWTTIITLVARMFWTQLICLFAQKIICNPRAVFMLVDGAFRIKRVLDIANGAGTGLAHWTAITSTYLECFWGGYDRNDPTTYDKIKDAHTRAWFRYLATGAALSMRFALAYNMMELGNGFASAVVRTQALRKLGIGQVLQTKDGKAVYIDEKSFLGAACAAAFGSKRPLIPRGDAPNTMSFFLGGNAAAGVGEWAGKIAGHSVWTNVVQKFSRCVEPFNFGVLSKHIYHKIAGPDPNIPASNTEDVTCISSTPSDEIIYEGVWQLGKAAIGPLGPMLSGTIKSIHAEIKREPLYLKAWSHPTVLSTAAGVTNFAKLLSKRESGAYTTFLLSLGGFFSAYSAITAWYGTTTVASSILGNWASSHLPKLFETPIIWTAGKVGNFIGGVTVNYTFGSSTVPLVPVWASVIGSYLSGYLPTKIILSRRLPAYGILAQEAVHTAPSTRKLTKKEKEEQLAAITKK